MTSFELDIDEKSYVGTLFMARVVNEIRRAAAIEKSSRKITQQAIADKIGTSRAVINREMQGLENLSSRRTAELLWALGWEPHFEARKIPAGKNQFHKAPTEQPRAIVGETTYKKPPPTPKGFEKLTPAGSNSHIVELT